MELELFCVRDIVIGHSSVILTANNITELRRLIKTALLQKNSVFTDNPKDKQIFKIGVLDCSTSIIKSFDTPLFMCSVQEIIDDLESELALLQAKRDLIAKKAAEKAEHDLGGVEE